MFFIYLFFNFFSVLTFDLFALVLFHCNIDLALENVYAQFTNLLEVTLVIDPK